MVDNLELILPLLQFDSEDDFYWLQILQRGKEHEDLGRNSRVVANYDIRSAEYLTSRYERIKDICNHFNARACLRLNRRSYIQVALKTNQLIADHLVSGQYHAVAHAYDSAIGKTHNEPVKRWVLDIDHADYSGSIRQYLSTVINEIMPDAYERDKCLLTLPSKSGWHMITTPFNVQHFNDRLGSAVKPYVEIHKNNPTNLYIP